jgi:hypothetical protein
MTSLLTRFARGVPQRLFAAVVAIVLLLAVCSSVANAAGTDCADAGLCIENARFSATLTDFRSVRGSSNNRPLSATIRFRNRSDQPLILGYVDGSASVLDDQGNPYRMQSARVGLRGLGVITRQQFDPKFRLAPGEIADAKIDVNAFIGGIVGTVYDFEFAVREIESVPGNQFRLGRETLIRYAGLRSGLPGRNVTPVAVPAATGAGNGAAPPPGIDPCQGIAQCVANGPLMARVERLQAEAVQGNNQGVIVRIAFRNLADVPMILNYKQSTGSMLDEHGQRYIVDSRRATDVQGMPVSTPSRASSQFTLAPGQSRSATFRYTRFVGRTPVGSSYAPELAVEQYELLPSNQLRLVREYALAFAPQRAGSGGATTPQDLGDALKQLRDQLKNRN